MHVEFNFEFNIFEHVFDPLGNATMLLETGLQIALGVGFVGNYPRCNKKPLSIEG
jgi:hypothetical protein